MLKQIKTNSTLEKPYQAFLSELKESSFSGDIDYRYSTRLTYSVDNSVYQFIPQAIVFPKSQHDLQTLLLLGQRKQYQSITFSARGGGTGTNAQSLNFGLIVDLSKHFTQVIEINREEQWIRVQSGMVKDALNDVLKPLGYFFSPDTSTSNRATIGGMINTDASGAGSLVYGKTSEHILEMTSVLVDGSVLHTKPTLIADIPQAYPQHLHLAQRVADLSQEHRDEVLRVFPKLNRFMTGYDLKHVLCDALQNLDLSRLLAGSEGTLGFVSEVTLKLTPLPQSRAMILLFYRNFDDALRHAPDLVKAKATAVETLDSKLLGLAQHDVIWEQVSDFIPSTLEHIQGLNMVEMAGDADVVEQRIHNLIHNLSSSQVTAHHVCTSENEVRIIYAMRKKAVGLLGKTKGSKKPVAFVEDTAVPPERLADYILEFRSILDKAQLDYGMFGHVDAGVLHVRPSLDLMETVDEQKLRDISDEICDLTLKYQGVMWGEHGKGVRGEYTEKVFGTRLYSVLREIKGLFDPDNRLNPGKLVIPAQKNDVLISIDAQKRASFDRQIDASARLIYSQPLACNGNGACFDYRQDALMCPSYKVTQQRIHSPKGRATVMREWLRLASIQNSLSTQISSDKTSNLWLKLKNQWFDKSHDFSTEVMDAMSGCLGCKACVRQCPVQVNVPQFRSDFLARYYTRYLRPVRDYFLRCIEDVLPWLAKYPRMTNAMIDHPAGRWFSKRVLKYVDLPKLSLPTLRDTLKSHPSYTWDMAMLKTLSPAEREKCVVIVLDPFTHYYDANKIVSMVKLLQWLGYHPLLLFHIKNGKTLHVKGFLKEFRYYATHSSEIFLTLKDLRVAMVGFDPAMTLVYRDEYRDVLPKEKWVDVWLIQEWLHERLEQFPQLPQEDKTYVLLSHCTEKTLASESTKQWLTILQRFGIQVQAQDTGCCGMAGSFGHELEHQQQSKLLYEMSWKKHVEQPVASILVTGYSCRSQIARYSHKEVQHPIEVLLERFEQHRIGE